MPYTGTHGELDFEADFIEALIQGGWEPEILYHKTEEELIQNFRNIVNTNNRTRLNDVDLSDSEMYQVMENLKISCSTPAQAHLWLMDGQVTITRDSDSPDKKNAGYPVILNIFNKESIAGGNSRYQIAEQPVFKTDEQYSDRRGDVMLLIFGIPVIHIELKASGVPVTDATNQITKYAKEGVFTGLFSTIQVFFAITPEDVLYYANAGNWRNFNPAFFFRWGNKQNKPIRDWRQIIKGECSLLSIPEAHQLVGYYTVSDGGKDILMVARSYQIYAIRAINARAQNQRWGNHTPLGGYVWCTTGGGKTLTSFKAGEQIVDLNRADKVIYVVDRSELNNQSADEYNNFCRHGEVVLDTTSSTNLFRMLLKDTYVTKTGTNRTDLLITSMQKLARVNEDKEGVSTEDLEKINRKRIVFIIDEAHRSQFGTMHEKVKRVFPNALFFGFTGTPIFSENEKEGKTTSTSFGDILSIYSIADGIRDKNVLGFAPFMVKTYKDNDVREQVALHECHAKTIEEARLDEKKWKIYQAVYKKEMTDIEGMLPSGQYDNDEHRNAVVEDIMDHWDSLAFGAKGTRFHALLSTSSIAEAVEYYRIFKDKYPDMNVTALFDPHIDNSGESSFYKEDAIEEIVADYNKCFGTSYNRDNDPDYKRFKSDITQRLAHKRPYQADTCKRLDIVIVVNQLLTGFDSKYINTLYLDREMETDNLIQAISRTNRIYDEEEKPFGLFRYYRKPYTMAKNLEEALKLYCMGETVAVVVAGIDENLDEMNTSYKRIEGIFTSAGVTGFGWLPADKESCESFKKEFKALNRLLNSVKLQGFTWQNEYAAKLIFDERTYEILKHRYDDLKKGRTGGDPIRKKPGYSLDPSLSEIEKEKIDAEYLEHHFRNMIPVLTGGASEDEKLKAISDFEKELAILSMEDQDYARHIISDIKTGLLTVDEKKTLVQYIAERKSGSYDLQVRNLASEYGVDVDLLFEICSTTTSESDLNRENRFNRLLAPINGLKAKAKASKELRAFILGEEE